MKLPSIPFLAEALYTVLQRFPFVMTAAATGVFAAMMLIEEGADLTEDVFEKLLMTAALGLPLLLGASLVSRPLSHRGAVRHTPTVIALSLLVVYYLTLDLGEDRDHYTTVIRFMGLNVTAHLMVSFLPYLTGGSLTEFWEYNKRLFGNFVIGAFYSLVVYAGLSIAILAVDNLFDLHVDDSIYGHLFVLLAGIVNTAFFLFHFPDTSKGLTPGVSGDTRAFLNLCKYVLIPIVGVYFLILYAYSLKILIQWELPKGWVSSLVLGFSVAGIFTYLLNYLLPELDDSRIVKLYKKRFFFVLFPMVILLFVAIGRRLSDYGVTEERYIVAMLGVWLLLISVYFILSRRDDIKFIPVSLAVIALVSVLGFFNMFRVSERSQTGRLEVLLRDNRMLVEGSVVPSPDSLSADDAQSIRSILNYLRDHDHFASVAPWFGVSERPSWQEVDQLIADLELDHLPADNNRYCHLNFQVPPLTGIADYEGLVFTTNNQLEEKDTSSGISVRIRQGENTIRLIRQGETIDRIDLVPYLDFLNRTYDCMGVGTKGEDAVFRLIGESYELKILTEWISYQSGPERQLDGWKGVVLYKKIQ